MPGLVACPGHVHCSVLRVIAKAPACLQRRLPVRLSRRRQQINASYASSNGNGYGPVGALDVHTRRLCWMLFGMH